MGVGDGNKWLQLRSGFGDVELRLDEVGLGLSLRCPAGRYSPASPLPHFLQRAMGCKTAWVALVPGKTFALVLKGLTSRSIRMRHVAADVGAGLLANRPGRATE